MIGLGTQIFNVRLKTGV